MRKAACFYVLVGLLLLPALAAAQPLSPGELLASTGSQGGELLTLDPATGDGTFRCPLGGEGPVTEIEFRSDGVLFATTGDGASALITIDPVGCVESLVGTHDFGSVNGLEFVGDTLYGTFFNATPTELGEGVFSPTSLVIVDQSDASLTVIEALPFHPVRGLAWDPATSTMYGIGPAVPIAEGVGDFLFTVDVETGVATPIDQTGYTFGSLEFGPDGLLYAGQNNPKGPGEGPSAGLYLIDPSTAQATLIGPTGAPAVSGLSFAPDGANILAIPTLSLTGITAFGGLLLVAGTLLLRRRLRSVRG